jgi:hypothetical protein
MKYIKICSLTRPDVSIPFFPENSTHLPESESDWTNTVAFKYYVETYVDTGKCELTVPSLSEDRLTLTYTTIYLSIDAVNEMINDDFYYGNNVLRDSKDKRRLHSIKHKFTGFEHIAPLDD